MKIAKKLGLRWVSFDRPAYGDSTRHEGRTVGSIADVLIALDDDDDDDDAADPRADFTARDWATLGGTWGWLSEILAAGLATGPDGLIDDNTAFVTPWGVDLSSITAPTLLTHGGEDRVVPSGHSRWLASAIPDSEHGELPQEGHLSVLAAEERGAQDALRWLAEHQRP